MGTVGNLPDSHKNCRTYFAIDSRKFVLIELIRIHAQLYHVTYSDKIIFIAVQFKVYDKYLPDRQTNFARLSMVARQSGGAPTPLPHPVGP